MPKHEHYEELCALATAGQLSADEERELQAHAVDCEECRIAAREFHDLLAELPPLDDTVDLVALRRGEEDGYRKRFLVRARGEGRRFSAEAERGRVAREKRLWSERLNTVFAGAPQWALGAAAATLLIAGIAYTYVGQRNTHQASAVTPEPASPIATSAGITNEAEAARLGKLQSEIAAAEKRIELLEAENSSLDRRLHAADEDRESAETAKGQSDQALARANETKTQLDEQLKQNSVLLANTRGELERLRTEHSVTLASLTTERRSVDDLSRELQLKSDGLDREKELLTAGRDVTDLMGARNLHVVDVYDGDGTGKQRKSYGRVFYTEGKSLIFYAFDLDERKILNAKYTYKAWGERQASPTSVKSLGILYNDDKAERRWALKVDDPQQLSEIDSVFVTLEPRDGGDTPHGQKLLFAFLGTSSNHP